jgi:hypothetical protein
VDFAVLADAKGLLAAFGTRTIASSSSSKGLACFVVAGAGAVAGAVAMVLVDTVAKVEFEEGSCLPPFEEVVVRARVVLDRLLPTSLDVAGFARTTKGFGTNAVTTPCNLVTSAGTATSVTSSTHRSPLLCRHSSSSMVISFRCCGVASAGRKSPISARSTSSSTSKPACTAPLKLRSRTVSSSAFAT